MAGDLAGRGHRFGGGTLVKQRSRDGVATGERERLRSLAGFRVLDTGPEPEFDATSALIRRIGATEGAAVTFVDGGREWVKAALGIDLTDVPRAVSFGGRLVARGAPLVIEDALSDPLAASYPWVAGDPGIRFYAGVPLTAGGLVIGALALLDREPHAASEDLIDALSEAARVLMPHLERRRADAMAANLTAVLDFEGRYLRVSGGFEAVLGWTPADMIGRPVTDFVHPDDLPATRERLATLRAGAGDPGGFECRYRGKDGGHRWLLWNSEAVQHEGRIYSAGKDITDRKRQETALRESEARYRLLAENATDMIAGHDLDAITTYVSSGGQALTGFQAHELIGVSAYDMVHPADVERLRAAHAGLLDNGDPQRVTVRLRRKDGDWVWVETIARVVRDEHSRPVGLQSTTRDITETRRAVEALEAAREHFRRAFDEAPIGMGIVDPRGRFDRVNDAMCHLLGYSEEELVGSINPLELVHPDDRGGEREGLREILAGGRRTFTIERRLIHKDGHSVWARITTSVMRGTPDAPASFLSNIEDVSERRRNAEDLLRAREEAESADRAKSEFLSRMSHELRTPLNAVLGFAQLLDADDISESQRESVGRILRGGYHLLDLVNDVLDISAIESGRLPIPTESVSTAAVVGEAVEMMRPIADERSVRLTCDLPSIDIAVESNGQRLKQVLLNLVANAVKYSSPSTEVTVAVRRAGDMRALIEVSDTGPGIPADRLERAFVPFERLGAQREVEGTGLGLPLSRNLVQAMGGELTAASGPGGSTFTVDLPLATGGPAGEPRINGPDDGAAGVDGDDRSQVMLYIEDNPSNVELVERLADRRPGLEMYAAARGDAGIELARRLRPDLIVLDLHLPDTTGDAVLAQLRSDTATADVPVIVVTADVSQGHAQRLNAAGATAFMTKPLDLGSFGAAIDRALAGARPR